MLRLSLIRHPHSPSPAAAIAVDIRRASSLLALTYHVVGAVDHIVIPAPTPAARADELWKHTCFEAFIGVDGGYHEFNFSPSSQWAAYRFDGYRAGMQDAANPDPTISWSAEAGRASLSVTLSLPSNVLGPLGLSAVIEDVTGARSFWALAHPSGPPDFHNAACFAGELPPAG